MSLELILTDIVKEKGISNIIIQMKESFELKDNIKEHIKRNNFVLNEIKQYDSGYLIYIGMNFEIDWIEYTDGLQSIENKYSDDIRNCIRARFETPVREIHEDFERRINNGEIDANFEFLVYINKNMEIIIMKQEYEINSTESEITDEQIEIDYLEYLELTGRL